MLHAISFRKSGIWFRFHCFKPKKTSSVLRATQQLFIGKDITNLSILKSNKVTNKTSCRFIFHLIDKV